MTPSRLAPTFFRKISGYQILSLVAITIMIMGIPESFSVNQITLSTSTNSYTPGEVISVKGQVENSPNHLVAIEVKNPNGISMMIRTVQTTNDGNFILSFKLSPTAQSGDYAIIADSEVNGSMMKTAKSITFTSVNKNILPQNAPVQTTISIPNWIKNNANWWSTGKISDSDFRLGIGYLIQHAIIVIPQVASSSISSPNIPSWVKSDAGWWSEDQISDSEFVGALQYLISNGIIIVR